MLMSNTVFHFKKSIRVIMQLLLPFLLCIASLIFFTSCQSGSSGNGPGGLDQANFGCDGSCPSERLLRSDVELILKQGIQIAKQHEVSANFAILDRVGNVLAAYQMDQAVRETRINGETGAVGGLEQALVPAILAAISKAGTGAYLSSQGNAFTTRTAGQIIQEHFNPGENRQPGGPLFGVQFSQLICSDTTILDASSRGPRPLPLGLSADPGGIPLYKNGDLVGGLGVEIDGLYTYDKNILDFDDDIEERIALGASRGFEAPSERTGNRIFVLGKSLRYTDLRYDDISIPTGPLPELSPQEIIAVPAFFDGEIKEGIPFGSFASGIQHTTRAGVPVSILLDGDGNERFPVRSGTPLDGMELQTEEVHAILDAAIVTAFRTRAAIRRPLDTPARVSIWVVDHKGIPLGFIRSQDAPVFGIDVSLQKARTATFFSSADAASILHNAGLGEYLERARSLLGSNALTGTHAFADRSGGNLSRPFFPDGIETNAPGPFSLPFPGSVHAEGASRTWSPFNTGLQLDIALDAILAPLSGTIPNDCAAPVFSGMLKNGMQIFPGSVPLYRGTTLIGGIGVSGDGIDQDDLISFYSVSRRGLDFIGKTEIGDPILGFNAPSKIRADKIDVAFRNIRLRYVNCPEAPFIGDNSQNVCDGL
jgi:uncharacterized protein GlcG (DUF336 family)